MVLMRCFEYDSQIAISNSKQRSARVSWPLEGNESGIIYIYIFFLASTGYDTMNDLGGIKKYFFFKFQHKFLLYFPTSRIPWVHSVCEGFPRERFPKRYGLEWSLPVQATMDVVKTFDFAADFARRGAHAKQSISGDR